MSAEVAMERVEAGAALLDVEMPGWEHKIDLAILDLRDGCRCVLGQVFGDGKAADHATTASNGFGVALERVAGLAWCSQDLGFLSSGSATTEDLDEAWIALIKRRHDLGVFSDTEPDGA